MKRTFDFGKIDYYNNGRKENLVTVEMEYKTDGDKKRFSVSASVWNRIHTGIVAGGQCLDRIAQYIHDPVYSEIVRLWELYHLNDMHPECEHQAALGWREKAREKVTLYHWRLTRAAQDEKRAAEKAAVSALQTGETFTPNARQIFMYSLPHNLTTHTATIPGDNAAYYEPQKALYPGATGHTETKALGWLRETEHPDGLLCRSCPVCGYKYGSEWKYFPIPENDEKIILNLLQAGRIEQ